MYLYLLCVLLCSIETIIVSLCANKDIIIIIIIIIINDVYHEVKGQGKNTRARISPIQLTIKILNTKIYFKGGRGSI